DITRTICNHMTKNIYANIRNIQSEIIDSIKDGSLGKDIESLYETLMKRDNFKIAHKCYHGIGLEVHEPLPEVIKKDMILCVEVGAYFPGRFGVRIEDMIRVRKNKAEVLSNF
ncbi:MAG TPA: M24 family metallopeptidase, partial [Candidatus Aenigmarchaeota archaeon]|nr:M24 family metallopeptidase [Candidatus Aenigmarchaeota archaeon]